MKSCAECKQKFPIREFRIVKNSGRPRPYCRDCDSLRNRRAHLARRYGLTLDDYEKMYRAIDGHCPLCGVHYEVLAIDHCHATGKVRGLLCLSCNRSLGYVEDGAWLKRAMEYLQ